jgi:DNA (cytosine-5)-methyltransferase 1
MTLKMLSLFSGIGGLDLAARWAGIETVAFCEIEPFCRKVLAKHWPDVPIFHDVKQLTTESLRRAGIDPESISVVAGGFPCQPFSLAGLQRGTDDPRNLWPEMSRVIRTVKPRWVVAENVPRIISIQRELALQAVLSDLEAAGYEVLPPLLYPACGVGALHQRNRVFFVAHTRSSGHGQLLQPKCQPRRGAAPDLGGDGEVRAVAYADSRRQLQPQGGEQDQQQRTGNGHPGDWRQWEVEPGMGRVVDGIPGRLDRLRALGNAVVPQQVLPIFEAIVTHHNSLFDTTPPPPLPTPGYRVGRWGTFWRRS